VAELAVHRPLDERHVHDDLGLHPVCAHTREPRPDGERRLLDLGRIEPRAQVHQQCPVETGADLAGEDELTLFIEANQQGPESDAASLRISESADHEVAGQLALHLEPVLRALVLVHRVATLRDDTLPALGARAVPRFVATQLVHSLERCLERQPGEHRASLLERNLGQVTPIDP
jgi:hypothetical protein